MINIMCLIHPETILPHFRPMEKLSSMNPVPGAKKVGDCCPKGEKIRVNISKWDLLKLTSFAQQRKPPPPPDTYTHKKTQHPEWEKILANDMTDKEFISKIHK